MDKNSIFSAEMMEHVFFVRVQHSTKVNGLMKNIDFVVPVLINKNETKIKNLETNQIYEVLNKDDQEILKQAVEVWDYDSYKKCMEHEQIFGPIKNSTHIHQTNCLENTFGAHEPEIISLYKAHELQSEVYRCTSNCDKKNLKLNLQRPVHLLCMSTVDMPLKDILKLAKSSATIFNIKNRKLFKKRKQNKKEVMKNEEKQEKIKQEDNLNF